MMHCEIRYGLIVLGLFLCCLHQCGMVFCFQSVSDLLEVALLVVYKEVRTSTGRDQCRVAIETNLFPALWPLLLDVLR